MNEAEREKWLSEQEKAFRTKCWIEDWPHDMDLMDKQLESFLRQFANACFERAEATVKSHVASAHSARMIYDIRNLKFPEEKGAHALEAQSDDLDKHDTQRSTQEKEQTALDLLIGAAANGLEPEEVEILRGTGQLLELLRGVYKELSETKRMCTTMECQRDAYEKQYKSARLHTLAEVKSLILSLVNECAPAGEVVLAGKVISAIRHKERELDQDGTQQGSKGPSNMPMDAAINIVFDGPPGDTSGRFIEVETDQGNSIQAGEWRQRDDGYWVLRIDKLPRIQEQTDVVQSPVQKTVPVSGERCHSMLTVNASTLSPPHDVRCCLEAGHTGPCAYQWPIAEGGN